jgi:hypothetical protein
MKKTKDYSGQLSACGHYIDFYYRDVPTNSDSQLTDYLDEMAEERARELIADDYVEGELCCCYLDDNDKEHEYRGWWKINRDR